MHITKCGRGGEVGEGESVVVVLLAHASRIISDLATLWQP